METAQKNTRKLDRNAIANDFKERYKGTLDQSKVEAAVNSIKSTQTAYPATGSIIGAIFYTRITIEVKNTDKRYLGEGGGLSGIGAGALIGDIYTDDINRLYANAVSFEFHAAFAYTAVNFFDKDSNHLGSFQSGSVSTVAGVGGGTGKWS